MPSLYNCPRISGDRAGRKGVYTCITARRGELSCVSCMRGRYRAEFLWLPQYHGSERIKGSGQCLLLRISDWPFCVVLCVLGCELSESASNEVPIE